MRAWVALAMLGLTGCTAMGQGPTTLSGQWGGPHIGIMLEGGLGNVQFGCASGTIDQTITSREGPFSVEGTYRTGQSGPVRVGQIFKSERATYSGTQSKGQMTLTVKLENGELLGPYTLSQGAPAQLGGCTG